MVLWGRCWEAGGAPAYWPWIQSIRGLLRDLDSDALRASVGGGGADLAQILPELRERLPDLPDPPPASPETARFRLFDALTAFLISASEDRPLLLVLEDLHAADASSLLLLRFVASEVNRRRMLILGTYRDVELTKDHPLAVALPELARTQGTSRISLSGLSQPDVGLFVETIAAAATRDDHLATLHSEP